MKVSRQNDRGTTHLRDQKVLAMLDVLLPLVQCGSPAAAPLGGWALQHHAPVFNRLTAVYGLHQGKVSSLPVEGSTLSQWRSHCSEVPQVSFWLPPGCHPSKQNGAESSEKSFILFGQRLIFLQSG